MKEDYNYDFPQNGDGSIYGCGAALILCVWFIIGMFIAEKIDDRAIGSVIVIFLVFIPFIIVVIVSTFAQASFTADDHAVIFRYLLKKTVIPYESIKSIDLKTEYREQSVRGGVNKYYAEVITFHCADGKDHTFAGKLETDFEEILKDPNYLQKQTENSKFTKLKHYIEDRTPIFNAETI